MLPPTAINAAERCITGACALAYVAGQGRACSTLQQVLGVPPKRTATMSGSALSAIACW